MGSTLDSEIAGRYINTSKAVQLRIILIKMRYTQPKTPLELDNITAFGILIK